MALDLFSLLAQASPRKPRRPVAERMLSIRVCDVRPLVEVNQQTIHLPQMGYSLSLLWRWRSGGCLGPKAAAAMNARQRQAREGRPATEPQLDRGATGGWHLDLVCPLCSRTCRRLFAPSWSQPARPSSRPWGCRSCHRVTYESNNRPGSSRGRRPPSSRYRKHEEAALKIRRDFMGVAPEELHLPSLFLAWRPRGSSIHWERWAALCQLVLAHETLSMAAWSEAIHRLALQVGADAEAPDLRLEISRAQELLKENSWATRQSSWHRRGWPRPGPSERLSGGRK
jgi:hypothetical protein